MKDFLFAFVTLLVVFTASAMVIGFWLGIALWAAGWMSSRL